MTDLFSLSVVQLCLKKLDKKILNIENELSKIKERGEKKKRKLTQILLKRGDTEKTLGKTQ